MTNIKINTKQFLNIGTYTHLQNQPRQRESNKPKRQSRNKDFLVLGTHLFVKKVPRPGDSEVTFSVTVLNIGTYMHMRINHGREHGRRRQNQFGGKENLPEYDFAVTPNQGCGSGSWKRLNFCGNGSTLKKEAGSGSELGSI